MVVEEEKKGMREEREAGREALERREQRRERRRQGERRGRQPGIVCTPTFLDISPTHPIVFPTLRMLFQPGCSS